MAVSVTNNLSESSGANSVPMLSQSDIKLSRVQLLTLNVWCAISKMPELEAGCCQAESSDDTCPALA